MPEKNTAGRADEADVSEPEVPAFEQHRPLGEEERAALLALDYEAASQALEREDPLAVALTTEFILLYSEKAGYELGQGRDYLPLLAPRADTPGLERIAMEIVLDSFEEELESEY